MRKPLPITGAVAAALLALPGCSNRNEWDDDYVAAGDTAVCVDQDGRRIDDDHCDRRRGGASFFFLRTGAPIPYYGDSVRNSRYARYGSYSGTWGTSYARAPRATQMTRSQAVSRGGLGATGRGFGGRGG
jgi:hypothetical protein